MRSISTHRAPLFILLAVCLTLSAPLATADTCFPGNTWQMYADPADAGFSAEQLTVAREYWESIDSAAAMLVHDGVVVVAWGDVERRYLLHSARKSFMSGLYGVHVDAGRIDVEKTLAELGIDDENFSLNETEKQARIIDLLRARSGVYHLAAAEPPQNPKPERGAYPPGEHWCYNNWDFNALCTIIEQELDIRFFEDLDKHFGKPLQMQDYSPLHGIYQFEPDKSIHPAYHIRMSARDIARYGLLFLNQGMWNGTRILSEQWVHDSGHAFSDDAWGDGYGLMWWVSFQEPFQDLQMYSALGVGNQSIDVLPGANLVFVNRTNTFDRDNVTGAERLELIRKLLAARTGEAKENPRLIPLPTIERDWQEVSLTTEQKRILCSQPSNPSSSTIKLVDGNLILESDESTYDLICLANNRILIDDLYEEMFYELNEDGTLKQIISEEGLNLQGYELLGAGQIDQAIAVFRKATQYYPQSLNVYDSLADGYLGKRDYEAAIASLQKILAIDPEHQFTKNRLQEISARQNPPEISPATLTSYLGRYNDIDVTLTNGTLFCQQDGSPQLVELLPLTQTEFVLLGMGVNIRFEMGRNEEVSGFTLLRPDGTEIAYPRTE